MFVDWIIRLGIGLSDWVLDYQIGYWIIRLGIGLSDLVLDYQIGYFIIGLGIGFLDWVLEQLLWRCFFLEICYYDLFNVLGIDLLSLFR